MQRGEGGIIFSSRQGTIQMPSLVCCYGIIGNLIIGGGELFGEWNPSMDSLHVSFHPSGTHENNTFMVSECVLG